MVPTGASLYVAAGVPVGRLGGENDMSLKAKMEAVIYASEEPVTLGQLAGLLGMEAAAELEELAGRQAKLHLASPGVALEEAEESEVEPLAYDLASEGGADSDGPDVAGNDEAATGDGAETSADRADAAAEKKAGRERERKVREYLREILGTLMAEYQTGDRGVEVREVAGGYRMATKPEYHDAVRGFVKGLKPVMKLTLQALETLAVVAYKQPITAPEISEIRGVDSGGVLGSLMARKLVTTAGRKQVIGRPILYKTTKDFLLRFGLKDVSELPSIEEFEKMAGELAEQEEMMMESAEERITHENLEEEKGASEPQADGDSEALTDEVVPVGRESGLPPEEELDPSGEEAAEQENAR